jgi:hypothetical protein
MNTATKKVSFHAIVIALALALVMTTVIPFSTGDAYAGSKKKSGNCYAKKIEVYDYDAGKALKLTPKFNKKKTKYTTKFAYKHGNRWPRITIWRDHKKAKIYRWDNIRGWSYIKGSKYVVQSANFGTWKFKIKAQNGKSKIYRVTIIDTTTIGL